MVLLVLSPRPAKASLFGCGEVVVQTWRAWRAGVGTSVARSQVIQEAPIELEDLKPDFTFVRGRLGGVVLLEQHSEVRLSFSGGVLMARVPVSEGYISQEIKLDFAERNLFTRIFNEINLSLLDEAAREQLETIFYEKVCDELFHISHHYLSKIGHTDPNFQMNGSSLWRLSGIDKRWEGFQVEGYIDRNGELVQTRVNSGRWVLLRVIVGKGLVEIRALPTDTTQPGYRFIRVPQARLLGNNGHFSKNLEKFAVSHYDIALKQGQLVNGDHFPYNHIHITRALEIGLDPNEGYSRLSYLNAPLVIVTGNFKGQRAIATEEAEASANLNGGYRRELRIAIEAQPITVSFFTSYVMPVRDEPMQVGLDPVRREPMVLAVDEEVIVRGSGERVKVVREHEGKGRGLVKHYEVEYLTGPLHGQRVELSTCELIPQRYLPFQLRPSLVPKPPESGSSDPASPTSEPTP